MGRTEWDGKITWARLNSHHPQPGSTRQTTRPQLSCISRTLKGSKNNFINEIALLNFLPGMSILPWVALTSAGSYTAPRACCCCYMVPGFSPELAEEAAALLALFGKIFSVGVTAGLPTPEELELLERCCVGGGLMGLIGGGLSWAPANLADSVGLKVDIISVVELLLRLRAASGSRIMMVCKGLAGSEHTGFLSGSNVSRTTSGACLAVFWRSNSRSSWSAVFIVFSISCNKKY